MSGTLRQAIDATTAAKLRARGSFKWTAPGPDGFGAAVAEMDFGAAPPILDALAGLSADAKFGYLPPLLAEELAAACAEFQQHRYGWDVDPALIHPIPDVIKGLEIAITHLLQAGLTGHLAHARLHAVPLRAGVPRPRDHPGADA